MKFYEIKEGNKDGIKVQEATEICNSRNITSEGNGIKVFFNIDLIPGIFTILTAANKTISTYSGQKDAFKLKTNSIASEFLYNLSPFTSITNALKAFGMNSETTKIGVIHFQRYSGSNITNQDSEELSIGGIQIPIKDAFDLFEDEERFNRIQKYCKLSNAELAISTIDEAFALHITMRDVK